MTRTVLVQHSSLYVMKNFNVHGLTLHSTVGMLNAGF